MNADSIAAGLSPLKPERAARAAGRLMLQEIDRLSAAGDSFALESTLSGQTFEERLQRLKKMGYRNEIIFLRLDTPELAIKRVAHRVKQGGHHVPDEDVRRRYARGAENLVAHFLTLSDGWAVYDNSKASASLIVSKVMSKAKQKAEADDHIATITRALKRAAKEARLVAKMHGTKIWVVKDGKIVGLDP